MEIHKALLAPSVDDGEILIHYLVHSCVAIRHKRRLMLFDYAASLFRQRKAENDFLGLAGLDELKGLEVYIFSSHRHGDHYSPDIFSLSESENFHYFTSFDIALPRTGHDVAICKPREWAQLGDVKVYSGESSDEGVAFWVEFDGRVVYYSGDNAFWDWNACRVAEGYFRDHLLPFIEREKSIDVAFQVADPRCHETHYGGIHDISTFLDIGLLVPIHNFGDFSHHETMRELVLKKHKDQQYFGITGPDQFQVYKFATSS